ncbi:hypothetical protein MOO44_03870 [Nicoliella spurrieriana]|uniref:Uncharacterized protein n=1 Tax=Nicoliella spurrieriana TaxID=2925830 RepID=A0A976RT98_9LACO|nr:hypothetical protein [Nicoliella spurrieriana]UQS87304.1 hypothetical protein MOO44_03870 [Nicoliella spurrieriana]
MHQVREYLMIVSYAILLIGIILDGLGWWLFKLRALRNKPAWDGIGGKLLKFGIVLTMIGFVMVGFSLYWLGQ